MSEIDYEHLKTIMGQFCTGVVVVTGCLDGRPAGFAAQTFVSLSLDPPLVALCPAKTSTSWPAIRDSGAFCVNMLAATQEALCDNFARPGGDKYVGIDWTAAVTGSPVLEGVLAYADCELAAEHDAGDHTIAVGRVKDLQLVEPGEPLLFFRGAYGSFAGFMD
jgi:3-hydroxy-9,10-secoandrosta-1,3,5(10)-triene-9,17-dione monooxygenase reductase component